MRKSVDTSLPTEKSEEQMQISNSVIGHVKDHHLRLSESYPDLKS